MPDLIQYAVPGFLRAVIRSYERLVARVLIGIARLRGFFFYARPGDERLYCDGRCDQLHKATVLCSFLDQYNNEIIKILQERASRLKDLNSFVDAVTAGTLISSDKKDAKQKIESR